MRKTPRNQKDREAHFDIAAHKREIDRLLRENAKLKAQNLTLERELLMRPPYEEPKTDCAVTVEDINKYLERIRSSGKSGDTNAA